MLQGRHFARWRAQASIACRSKIYSSQLLPRLTGSASYTTTATSIASHSSSASRAAGSPRPPAPESQRRNATPALIEDLEATRWTGRPGYPIRALVGVCLVKSLYALPSIYACYRFGAKLRAHHELLERCIERVLRSLKSARPELGHDLAIDASDMPAYANGQRYVSKGDRERAPEEYSDPDASWGHRSAVSTRKGGGFYGYRVHMAVCHRDRAARRLACRDRACQRVDVRRAAPRRSA
jgi:hypothetical protein